MRHAKLDSQDYQRVEGLPELLAAESPTLRAAYCEPSPFNVAAWHRMATDLPPAMTEAEFYALAHSSGDLAVQREIGVRALLTIPAEHLFTRSVALRRIIEHALRPKIRTQQEAAVLVARERVRAADGAPLRDWFEVGEKDPNAPDPDAEVPLSEQVRRRHGAHMQDASELARVSGLTSAGLPKRGAAVR